jgi:hypothetical protein
MGTATVVRLFLPSRATAYPPWRNWEAVMTAVSVALAAALRLLLS